MIVKLKNSHAHGVADDIPAFERSKPLSSAILIFLLRNPWQLSGLIVPYNYRSAADFLVWYICRIAADSEVWRWSNCFQVMLECKLRGPGIHKRTLCGRQLPYSQPSEKFCCGWFGWMPASQRRWAEQSMVAVFWSHGTVQLISHWADTFCCILK